MERPKSVTELSREELEDLYLNSLRVNHEAIHRYNDIEDKYNTMLEMLVTEYGPPCELNDFMTEDTDYCEVNCGVDDEVFKKCWDRYIEWRMRKNEK